MAEWGIGSYLSLKHQDICWAYVLLPRASPLALPLRKEADVPSLSWFQEPIGQHCTWVPTPQAPGGPQWETAVCPPSLSLCSWLHEMHAVLQARLQHSLFSGLWSVPSLVFHHIRLRAPEDARPDCVFLGTHFGWMRGVCSDQGPMTLGSMSKRAQTGQDGSQGSRPVLRHNLGAG